MDLRSNVVIEIKKNDNVFQFVMPMGSPFGEAYDAAFQCLSKIIEMAKEAAEKAKPKDEEDKSKEN